VHTQTFYSYYYTGQPGLDVVPCSESLTACMFFPTALHSNYEEAKEFSSTVLSTSSPYLQLRTLHCVTTHTHCF